MRRRDHYDINDEVQGARRLVMGGTAEFWKYFRWGLLLPLISILWQVTIRRRTRTRASVAGAQCGSAAMLVFSGALSSLIMVWTLTPSAPNGVDVIPIIVCGAVAPVLTFMGTHSYLVLHGRHRRSSLHIILAVGVALFACAVMLFIVLYSLLSGMWTSM
jgi:di/tricarboxylate transporter